MASDGLPGRCVGPWSEEKVYYISRYAEIFSSGMKRISPSRAYVDLFSGPGCCVRSDGKGEFPGTPIRALQSKEPFTDYHLVEQATELFQALQQRVSSSPRIGGVKWYNEDANTAARKIRATIGAETLVLAVIDPTCCISPSTA